MIDLAGKHIKGYDLQERIGTGGFGAVYKAFQSTVGREVAIKIILPGYANEPEFIQRFEAEAQLIAHLEHLHIVPLYDYWRDPDGAFLVMRWLRGGSLYNHITSTGALSIEDTVLMIEQIARALHTAHRNQVIHRDIKPGNILLDEDGNAFVADFGIAKDHRQAVDITQPDNLVGSPDYLAPEQARREPVTPQTDIYSLGVVLYEMLQGQHPFPGLSPIERLFKHLNEPLPELQGIDYAICDSLNAVIQKATAKDPKKRYDDVLKMAQALREAARLDTPSQASLTLVELLTPRQQEVLQLIIAGKSNREIADELVLATDTVKGYVREIYRKLNVRSRVQAIVKARELDLIVGKPATSIRISQLPEPENPYKGLQAFQAADAHEFFGREELVQKLLSRLQEDVQYRRFLALVGPSGSGKSSVVRAGLIPALWRGDLPGSDNWYIVDLIPGDHPLDELEVALTRIATRNVETLSEHLARDERGLLRAANLILPDDGSELLLVIDQFEEVFTLVENETDRQHFLNLILQAVKAERSRVRIVITLRADYYDRPLQHPDMGVLMRSRVETVLPLSAEELEHAVRKPADQVSVMFEDGLVSQIVSDVHYQPGALPLMQYALTELFERREGFKLTHQAYEEIGGTAGALAKRADEIYLELSEEDQELVRQLFLRLVTLGEGAEDTRRRTTHAELLEIAADSEAMEEIIDVYAVSRLLALDHDPSSRKPTVEVAHEAILREWDRLRSWLSESREDIRHQRLLAASTMDWLNADKDTSYLLHGSRLDQMESWQKGTRLALTATEQAFLHTSIATQKQQEESERERQAHELELADAATQSALQAADSQRRAVNRLRYLVVGMAVFLLMAISLTLIALNEQNNAKTARDSESKARAAAEDSLRFSQAQRLGLEGTSLALADGEADLIGLLALQSLDTEYTPQGDFAIQQAMQVQYQRTPIRTQSGLGNWRMALSPNGTRLAVGAINNIVSVWDLSTQTLIGEYEGGNRVLFLPDGKRLIAATDLGSLRVWDVDTGQLVHAQDDLQGFGWSIALLMKQNMLALGGYNNGEILLLDLDTWKEKARLDAHEEKVDDMTVSSDGNMLLTGSTDGMAHLWDIETLTQVASFDHQSELVDRVAFSPDGKQFASITGAGNVFVWAIDQPDSPLHRINAHDQSGQSIIFSHDGQTLISGSNDTQVRFWDVGTGLEVQHPLDHPNELRDVLLSNDGDTIYVASIGDPFIRVWDTQFHLPTPQFKSQVHLHHNAFSPDGRKLAMLRMFTITLADLETGETVEYTHDAVLNAMAFSPDGRYFLFGEIPQAGAPGDIFLWNVQNQVVERTLVGLTGNTMDISVSPDNQFVVGGDFDGNVIVWDFETGNQVFSVEHGHVLTSVDISPDGRLLLASDWGRLARLYDTQTGEVLWSQDLTDRSEVRFAPDGQTFVVGGAGRVLTLWDVETLTHIRDYVGHLKGASSADFSPDGNLLISGSGDGTARIWSVATGEELRRFTSQSIGHVLIAPDGEHALVDDNDYATIWDIDIEDAKKYLCTHISRDFTDTERELYEISDREPTCPQLAPEDVTEGESQA